MGWAEGRVPKKDEGPPPPLDIQLGGAGEVRGVVTDAGGQPVQGALVTLAPEWTDRTKVPWPLIEELRAQADEISSAIVAQLLGKKA